MERTFLTLCVLVLAAFAGCAKTETPISKPGTETKVSPTATSTEGVVIPLQPAAPEEAKPDNKPAEKAAEKKEGAFVAPANAAGFGKIAAEAVIFPPVADLVAQIDEYVKKLGKTLDEDLNGTANYKSDSDAVVRDASGLTLVALTTGIHPSDSKYKKAAPVIIEAATTLIKADKYSDAKKALAALQESLKNEGDPSKLAWVKVTELTPVMKAVPNLSSYITRQSNKESKLTKAVKNPQLFGALAALAAISQGSIANAKDTGKADKEAEWKKDCEAFRDAALKANAAAHNFADGGGDYATYEKALTELTQSCDGCHKTFHASAVGKSE
jgi:hypothetical protein